MPSMGARACTLPRAACTPVYAYLQACGQVNLPLDIASSPAGTGVLCGDSLAIVLTACVYDSLLATLHGSTRCMTQTTVDLA